MSGTPARTSSGGPGRAIDLAAGEGRNSIWLAEHGWDETAILKFYGLRGNLGLPQSFRRRISHLLPRRRRSTERLPDR